MKADKITRILLLAVSIILLLGTIISFTIYENEKRRSVRERIDRLNKIGETYKAAYRNEVLKCDRLKADYEMYDSVGKSMTMLIFQQCKNNLYDEVYQKVLKSRKLPAVFTVWDTQMIGEEGCINAGQLRELLDAGWRIAIGTPDKETDFDEYLILMRERFEKIGIAFPEIFVFGMDAFSADRLKTVLDSGFKAVAYWINGTNGEGDIKEAPLTEEDGVLYIPYLYTSKQIRISDEYLTLMENRERCSISTACTYTSAGGEDEKKDVALVNLKDIVETITVENHTYRSYDSYRAEKLTADSECEEKLRELSVQIGISEDLRKKYFSEWIDVYS